MSGRKTKKQLDLEAEFEVVAQEAKAKINEKLQVAIKALNEATDIADEYGVPFYSNISELGQNYVPSTLAEKYKGIPQNIVEEATGVYVNEDLYGRGWERSALC